MILPTRRKAERPSAWAAERLGGRAPGRPSAWAAERLGGRAEWHAG